MRLTREIRCFPESAARQQPASASPAGLATSGGLEMFWVLRLTVEGPVDARTGYLCSIKEIDALLHGKVVPQMLSGRSGPDQRGAASALLAAWPIAQQARLGACTAVKLELAVSPFLRFSILDGDEGMVSVTQSFEFAAAHRLHCPELSDAENDRIFGRCSNPNGHGHNYVLEITVKGEPDQTTGTIIDQGAMHSAVSERVLAHFDHKHLNLDCPDFASQNPSVENIARAIWSRLEGAFDQASLSCVRIWETSKTSAEYRGGG